jgi:hypothetical protein
LFEHNNLCIENWVDFGPLYITPLRLTLGICNVLGFTRSDHLIAAFTSCLRPLKEALIRVGRLHSGRKTGIATVFNPASGTFSPHDLIGILVELEITLKSSRSFLKEMLKALCDQRGRTNYLARPVVKLTTPR